MGFLSPWFPAFLPALLLLYYRIPGRHQWKLLLAGSWVFYLGAGPLAGLCLGLTGIAAWLGGLALEKRKGLLWPLLILQAGLLLLIKTGVTFGSLLLPLGISYYSLQAMGYLIDTSRGKPPERNIGKLLLFLSYFPQLVQGPISRRDQLAPELFEAHPYEEKNISRGLQRLLWGYFKKLVLADRLAPAVEALRAPESGSLGLLLLSFLYAMRIWADFTGGMDMVLGVSRMLGISLPENFRDPFRASSPGEFWRRWHISLGSWMREYVFYPVSVCAPMRALSRFSRRRLGPFGRRLPVHLAALVTWLATGLWHGLTPNFLIWGLLNWLLVTLVPEKGYPRWLGVSGTFLAINIVRLCDLYPNPGDFFARLIPMAGTLPPLPPETALLIGGAVLAMAAEAGKERLAALPSPVRRALLLGLSLAVLLLGRYGIGYEGASFIYDRF